LQTAKLAGQNDLHLNSDQAADSITATLAAHEKKFEELQRRWQAWQDRRQSFRTALQTVEEIQIWQVS
jgi:prefoldin subunit 5